jgi:cytosine/adenosine deaminase-related metal-dependent hydrolase
VVDRLRQHGILNPNSIIVHAVQIDAREVMLLKEAGCWVTHQPRSNMNNAVGIANVESYLRAGLPVCLGNDGFSNAMWEEWKAAYLAHKIWNRDPRRMGGYDVTRMAIDNNSALASSVFGLPVGVIAEGAAADLIFVDYQPYTEMTAGNLPWHIIFGFHDSMVTTTIVAGQVLMRDRELTTLDEAEIAAKAREVSARTWVRYQAQF